LNRRHRPARQQDNSMQNVVYFDEMVKRRAKPVAFEVIKIGARGVLLGVVYAEDEAAAREQAIEQFNIRPVHVRSLLVRKV
jgi:hypothetical protein